MDTLKKVVMRLPAHLQAKWAEESSNLIEADIEPEFSHLTDFVERQLWLTPRLESWSVPIHTEKKNRSPKSKQNHLSLLC